MNVLDKILLLKEDEDFVIVSRTIPKDRGGYFVNAPSEGEEAGKIYLSLELEYIESIFIYLHEFKHFRDWKRYGREFMQSQREIIEKRANWFMMRILLRYEPEVLNLVMRYIKEHRGEFFKYNILPLSEVSEHLRKVLCD
jgi:hypothetical protein